jgi:replicative DNA helicase
MHQLPNNFEAEQGVLGAILYEPRNMSLVADKLVPDDFYAARFRHPEIYQAMTSLYAQERELVAAAVLERLKREDITYIDDRPAAHYLDDLWTIALEHGPQVKEHADIVLNTAILRRLYKFLGDAAAALSREENGITALEKMQALLSQVNEGLDTTDLIPLSEVMRLFLNDLDTRQRERGKIVGIPTGFDELDGLLGGLQKQELIVVGGSPGEGKTSLLLNIVYDLLISQQLSIAFFSLEMGYVDLARRLVSMDTQIDSQLLRARFLEDEHWNKVVHSATDALSSNRIFIDDSGDLTLASMHTKLQRHKMRHGLDLIVLDYLQLMQFDGGGDAKRYQNEVQELSRISRGLKKLAKSFNVPVLALASLNRAKDARADPRPRLSDLRGSGSIESDADVVMFISRSRMGSSLINIEKHRNGPLGDVTLRFDASLTRFYNMDEETTNA